MKRAWFWVASVAVNVGVWGGLSAVTSKRLSPPPDTQIVVERVELSPVEHLRKQIYTPVKVPPRTTTPTPPERHDTPRPPQPQDNGHNHLLTAKPDASVPSSDAPPVVSGGNADQGVPLTQGTGDGKGGNPTTPPAPPPAPHPDPKPTPPPAPPPTPHPDPKPTPPPPPPPPKPEPPPAPVKTPGITRDAEAVKKVEPTIPDELLSQSFRRSVRVRVRIATDGSFTVELRASSGNEQVDKLAMDALRKWKWRPKLVNGEPTEDVETFRFEFEVR